MIRVNSRRKADAGYLRATVDMGGDENPIAPSSRTSTTGGSADRLNTLEQVLIQSPATGSYTVTVR